MNPNAPVYDDATLARYSVVTLAPMVEAIVRAAPLGAAAMLLAARDHLLTDVNQLPPEGQAWRDAMEFALLDAWADLTHGTPPRPGGAPYAPVDASMLHEGQ